MTSEQKIKRIGDRQTIGLMVSYLIVLMIAFLVLAFI